MDHYHGVLDIVAAVDQQRLPGASGVAFVVPATVFRAGHDADNATAVHTDPAGRPLRQAAVHRELQAFLSAHPMALVELLDRPDTGSAEATQAA